MSKLDLASSQESRTPGQKPWLKPWLHKSSHVKPCQLDKILLEMFVVPVILQDSCIIRAKVYPRQIETSGSVNKCKQMLNKCERMSHSLSHSLLRSLTWRASGRKDRKESTSVSMNTLNSLWRTKTKRKKRNKRNSQISRYQRWNRNQTEETARAARVLRVRPVCTLEIWQLSFEGLQKFRGARTRRDHLQRRDDKTWSTWSTWSTSGCNTRQKLASSCLFRSHRRKWKHSKNIQKHKEAGRS